MLKIDEILKISNEIGIEIRDSKDGKHYILDDSGKEVEFSTDMLIKLEVEEVSYKLDLKGSNEYNLEKCNEVYVFNSIRVNESIAYAA